MSLTFREQAAIRYATLQTLCTDEAGGSYTNGCEYSDTNAVLMAQALADVACKTWGHDVSYSHDARIHKTTHYECLRCGQRFTDDPREVEKENK